MVRLHTDGPYGAGDTSAGQRHRSGVLTSPSPFQRFSKTLVLPKPHLSTLLAGSPYAADEGIPRWASLEEIEVGIAAAIRCSEASKRRGRAPLRAKALRPLVFPCRTIVAVPDLFQSRVPPQVVNVPVRPDGHSQMVSESGADASATEGAADIHVETALEWQRAKPPDANDAIFFHKEHQSVRAQSGFKRFEHEAPLPILSLGAFQRKRVHNRSQPDAVERRRWLESEAMIARTDSVAISAGRL